MSQLDDAQKKGAAELVQRARLMDQNAMGMIAAIRDQAAAGNARARTAFMCIVDYIKRNPVKSPMGAEVRHHLGRIKHPHNPPHVVADALMRLPHIGAPEDVGAACVLMSQKPPLTKQVVQSFADMFGADSAPLFIEGVNNSGDPKALDPLLKACGPDGIGILCAGHCIGMGRKLQLVAHTQAPLSILSDAIGWEHGEELDAGYRPEDPTKDYGYAASIVEQGDDLTYGDDLSYLALYDNPLRD